MGSMNSINPQSTKEVVEEGRNINLTCKYEGAIYSIHWYRQSQRYRPEFLLFITETGSFHPPDSDFSAHIDKTKKRLSYPQLPNVLLISRILVVEEIEKGKLCLEAQRAG
ncbi:hypothetical protein Q8A73_015624 [Channa argus]|nr:hypothetical protein Q8A73_015624 [Channa argus]